MFWFLYRQAVRNSLKNLMFLVLKIFRASSSFIFQVTTEEHRLFSFVCELSLSLLSHPSSPFLYKVVTPSPSFKFKHLFLLALMNALSIILRGNNLISVSKHSLLVQSILCLNCSVCLAIALFAVLPYSTSFFCCWTLFLCKFTMRFEILS